MAFAWRVFSQQSSVLWQILVNEVGAVCCVIPRAPAFRNRVCSLLQVGLVIHVEQQVHGPLKHAKHSHHFAALAPLPEPGSVVDAMPPVYEKLPILLLGAILCIAWGEVVALAPAMAPGSPPAGARLLLSCCGRTLRMSRAGLNTQVAACTCSSPAGACAVLLCAARGYACWMHVLGDALLACAGDCVTRLAAFPLGCSSAAFGSSTVHTLCEMAIAVHTLCEMDIAVCIAG